MGYTSRHVAPLLGLGVSSIGDSWAVFAQKEKKLEEYEARVEELLQAGSPWLNMSCYGVHEGLLVVAIEVPSPRPLIPGHATSVNLSGPARIVVDHQWCVDSILTIE